MKNFLIISSFLLTFTHCMNAQKNKTDNTAEQKPVYALIETSKGNIKVMLYNATPLHRDNFVKLANEHFYDSTLFHRVINGFMIQGGDPDSKNAVPNQMLGKGDMNYTIPAEFNPTLKHKKGALAAARMGDQVNPAKASSGCQFYIVQNDAGTPFLDGNYTVFGEVVEGLDVVDAIAKVQTNQFDRPVEDIRMKIIIVEK